MKSKFAIERPLPLSREFRYFWEEIPEIPDPEAEGIGYSTDIIRVAVGQYFKGSISHAKIADLGAGRGYGISQSLHDLGARRIIAADSSPEILKMSIYQRETVVADCSKRLPFGTGALDMVVSTGSHGLGYDNWKEIHRVLRRGGVYLGSDNDYYPGSQMDSFDAIITQEQFREQITRDHPELLGELARFDRECKTTLPLILIK